MKISERAFDVSIPTPLTNEIPHLSIYNILNKHLRNTWSRELIGKTSAQYGQEYESQKMMNGERSANYNPRVLEFTDPSDGQIYRARFEKINFSVDGALETEIDYLMHEGARYLSKLYPDDANSLITLTEAERQSYFNEALHMVHSYFDTEQLVALDVPEDDQAYADLYYRNKFLTGIVPVRSLTGVAEQEERLLNLLNTGTVNIYSGFNILSSPDQEMVISNNESIAYEKESLALDAYYFLSNEFFEKRGAIKLHGKTRSDNLEDLIKDTQIVLGLNDSTVEVCHKFTILNTEEPLDLLKDIIQGLGKESATFDLNELFLQATKENLVKAASTIDDLRATVYGDKNFDWISQEQVRLMFSQTAKSREMVVVSEDASKIWNPVELENKLLVTSDGSLGNIDKVHMLKLETAEFTEEFKLAIGNIVWSALTYDYLTRGDEFQLQLDTSIVSDQLLLFADIYQDGKLILSGEFDKAFFKDNNVNLVTSNYTYKSFEDKYAMNELFSRVCLKHNIENISLDLTKPIEIKYHNLVVTETNYTNNSIYLHDTFAGAEYDIYLTKGAGSVWQIIMNTREKETRVNATGELEETGYDLIKAITGSSALGTLKDSVDTLTELGTISIENNVLTLTLNGDTAIYDLPISNPVFERDLDIVRKDGQIVGGIVMWQVADQNIVNIDYVEKLADICRQQKRVDLSDSVDLGTKIAGEMIREFSLTVPISEDKFKNATIADTATSTNTMYINISWHESLRNSIEKNTIHYTATSYDDLDKSKYIYSTAYDLATPTFEDPQEPLSIVDLSKILFEESEPEFFELKTVPCYIYSEDTLRLEEDISSYIDMFGRINCIVLDGYGREYPTRVYKSNVKNSYCYVKLADALDGVMDSYNREGYLILDLKERADCTSEVENGIRRPVISTSTYRIGDNLKYFQKQEWAPLQKENLVYDFNNIYSSTVLKTYADNTPLSQRTIIPASLSQLENLTILDIDASETENLQLFKDLLTENRSLYLDSSIRILVNVPLATKALVRNEKYKTTSYVYNSEVPSYISFYNYKDFDSYEPLQEYINAINRDEVTLQDLTVQVSRRIVVWGNVVWDANNTNKTVRTLRTIWSGYFANFEIYSSDDVLPPEALVKSSLNSMGRSDIRNVNICNYNYAENKGLVDTNWILSTIVPTTDVEKMTVNCLDAYSHEGTIEEDSEFVVEPGSFLQITGYSLTANRLNIEAGDSVQLMSCDTDIARIDLDTKVTVRTVKDAMSVKYDAATGSYTFTANKTFSEDFVENTTYPLNLAYGMLHMQGENFAPVGCFRGKFGSDTALNMLMEHFVYDYYNNVCKKPTLNIRDEDIRKVYISERFESLTDRAVDFYASTQIDNVEETEAWKNDNRKAISLKDILNYVYNLYTYPAGRSANVNASNQAIPCIAEMQENGETIVHYFMLTKDAFGDFLIYESDVCEMTTGDLLYSIMPRIFDSFQVKPSVYNAYISAIQYCQDILPSNATGMLRDFDIDVNLEYKEDPLDSKEHFIQIADETGLTEGEIALKNQFVREINEDLAVVDTLGQTLSTRFKSLDMTKALVEADKLIVKDRSFRFEDSAKYFKEYYPVTIQMTTEDPENENADIGKCKMSLSRDLRLENKGYIYLYDIKAPNRRSTYTSSRETKLVDRSYTLTNLHIVGYKATGTDQLRLYLQDSNRSYTSFVKNAIALIKPVSDERTQRIVDSKLTLGFNWVDPGLEIDYTYYKRKFIFEGEISGTEPTRIYLADQDLNNDEEFKLTDHISVGDQIQIILNDPSGYYQDSKTISLDLTAGQGYEGPYKVIYTSTEVASTGAVQHVILSGPGNIVYVSIPLGQEGGEITYSKPIKFGSNVEPYYAYALSTGEIVFLDLSTKEVMEITSVDAVLQNYVGLAGTTLVGKSVMYAAMPKVMDSSAITSNSDGTYSINVDLRISRDSSYEDSLFTKHDDWYIFATAPVPGTEEGDETSPQSASDVDESEAKDVNMTGVVGANAPTAVFTNIPLGTGSIDFDNKDRIFFEPAFDDEEQSTAWLSLPDKAEMFDASGFPGAFEVVDAEGARAIISVSNATKTELVKFIRDTLSAMFKGISAGSLQTTIDTVLANKIETNPGSILAIAEGMKDDMEDITENVTAAYQNLTNMLDTKYATMEEAVVAMQAEIDSYNASVKSVISTNLQTYQTAKTSMSTTINQAKATITEVQKEIDKAIDKLDENRDEIQGLIDVYFKDVQQKIIDAIPTYNESAEITANIVNRAVDDFATGMSVISTLDVLKLPTAKTYSVKSGKIVETIQDNVPFNPAYYIAHPSEYTFTLNTSNGTVTKYVYDMPLKNLEKYKNVYWNASIANKGTELIDRGYPGIANKVYELTFEVVDSSGYAGNSSKLNYYSALTSTYYEKRGLDIFSSSYTETEAYDQTYEREAVARERMLPKVWNAKVDAIEVKYLEAMETAIKNKIKEVNNGLAGLYIQVMQDVDIHVRQLNTIQERVTAMADLESTTDDTKAALNEVWTAIGNLASSLDKVDNTCNTTYNAIVNNTSESNKALENLKTKLNNKLAAIKNSCQEYKASAETTIESSKSQVSTKVAGIQDDITNMLDGYINGTSEVLARFIANDNSEGFNIVDTSSTEIKESPQDVANSVLAKLLSKKTSGVWDPATQDIYVPVLGTMDMPIYFKIGENVKWQKVRYIESVKNQKIEDASIEDLREFANAILPVRYVSRECPVITSYAKNGNNIAAWDQNTGTLTIMDKNGNLKKRVAIPMIGIDHPILNTCVTLDTAKYPKRVKAFATSNMLYAKSSFADLYKYMMELRESKGIVKGTTAYTIYEMFGLNVSNTGFSYNTNAPLYLPRIINQGTAPTGAMQEYADLVELCSGVGKYQSWLRNAFLEDYLTTSTFDYASFRDPGNVVTLALLATVFENNATVKADIDLVVKSLYTMAATTPKGIPYLKDDIDAAIYNNFVNGMLTGMPTAVEGTHNFESLVKSSNIEVTNSNAHIFGTIDWPDLNDVKTRAKIAIETAYTTVVSNAEILQQVIDDITTRIVTQIRDNYTLLTGDVNYRSGERSFKVNVDLNNYYVNCSQVSLVNDDESESKIISISSTNEGLKVITDKNTFTLGDETAKVVSPDPQEITTFTKAIDITKGPIALVFDALRSTGSIARFEIDEDAVVQITTKGGLVNNLDSFYSTVSFVSDKELKIRDDTIVLENGAAARAMILVKDQTKDNFQLGYGEVTNIGNLPIAMTMFEVASAYYADFATYANKASSGSYNSELGVYEKESVFDLYPTYEIIDENKKKDFYKLDSDGKLEYLKNGKGRYVLRISEVFGDTLGGRILADVNLNEAKYKSVSIPVFTTDANGNTIRSEDSTVINLNVKKTVANEGITTETLKYYGMDVRNEGRVDINSILLPEARTRGKDYNRLVNMYSTQRIPALVQNPWDAVIKYPYKDVAIELNSASDIAIEDNCLVADFNLNVSDFENAIADKLLDLADTDTSTTGKMLASNKAQTNVIDASATPLRTNAVVSNILLKIVNATETLPRLTSITKFASRVDSDTGNLIFNTTSTEMYIPERGYGQALLGSYTLPQNCPFEEGIFYDSEKLTVNSNRESFVLVKENGEHVKDAEGNDVIIPKMQYKSFIQADSVLDTELATTQELDMNPTLIDLSKFEVTPQSISCSSLDVLGLLNFSKGTESLLGNGASGDNTYDFFRNRTKFACRLCWSELPRDAGTEDVCCLSDADIDNSFGYKTSELLNTIGYTRLYKSLLVPANIRYKTADDKYQVTSSLIARNLKAYSTDESGRLLYLNEFGDPVTIPTINMDPICAPKASKDLNMFTVSDSKISTIVNNVFYYSKYCLTQDLKTNSIAIESATNLRSLLMIQDPNLATSSHTNVEDVTEDENAWGRTTSFKFKFHINKKAIPVDLTYTKTVKAQEFNIAYLKSSDGQTIAKVYFEEPINSENLLIFQKNS